MLTLCCHYVDTMLTSFATFKHPLGPASPLKSPALDPSLLYLFSHDMTTTISLPKIIQNLKVSFRRNLPKTAIAPTGVHAQHLQIFDDSCSGIDWENSLQFGIFGQFPSFQGWHQAGPDLGEAPHLLSDLILHFGADFLAESIKLSAAPGLWGTLQPEQPRQCFVLH